jgi:hypothetical protein
MGIVCVGSFFLPFSLNEFDYGFLPWMSATAAAAAAFASSGTYLYTVHVFQPARMYCTPCADASWPLSGIG